MIRKASFFVLQAGSRRTYSLHRLSTIYRSGFISRQPDDAVSIVLCFDGTGYRFRGDEADSNVLKIYRVSYSFINQFPSESYTKEMLDRHNPNQFHYYQPGIGTNTSSIWMSDDHRVSLVKRCYSKAKDAAFCLTFDEHVMTGYRYFMRFYHPGDRMYIFGFSLGAYVARILAEMLDYVGLLEAGIKGKVRYVWSVFARWEETGKWTGREKRHLQVHEGVTRDVLSSGVADSISGSIRHSQQHTKI